MRSVVLPLAAIALAGCQFIPGTQEKMIADAQAAVAAEFLDPKSTQFTDVKVVRTVLNDLPNVSVCGKVNTKNLIGAYTGAKRFVFNKGRTLVDPAFDNGRYGAALDACVAALQADRVDANPYRRGVRSKVLCAEADEQKEGYEVQNLFEQIHHNNCVGGPRDEAMEPVADAVPTA